MAACENGQQAIEVLEKEYVDVVLTDICMPYVDGIELAKYIFERREGTKVLILSGYAEFEYAKQAMRYQVYSYLLKPITSDEMVQVMKDVRKNLELEQKDKKIKNLYQDNYSLLRAQRLMRIIQGGDSRRTDV